MQRKEALLWIDLMLKAYVFVTEPVAHAVCAMYSFIFLLFLFYAHTLFILYIDYILLF